MRVARIVSAALAACLPIIALVIAGAAWAPLLGAQMATHWSGDASTPDGFSSTWVTFWVLAGVTVTLTAGAIVAIAVSGRFRPGRLWAAIAALTAGLTAAAWIGPAWATVDAPSPAEAELGWRLIVMLGAPAAAALVFVLSPRGQRDGSADSGASQDAHPTGFTLAPGERVAWSARISSPMFSVIGLVLALAGVGLAVVGLVSGVVVLFVSAGVFLLAALSVLALTPVRLTVDRRGVRLTSLALGIPLVRVDLTDIDGVTAETIDPLHWGGWGYRFSARGRAYIARRGPGIVVRRRSGMSVAITVADAEGAAATAAALIRTPQPAS